MAILTVPISPTLSVHIPGFMSLEMQVACKKFIRRFCVIIRPVPVSQATASRIKMKLAVKVSQYLFSSVKVAHLEYLV